MDFLSRICLITFSGLLIISQVCAQENPFSSGQKDYPNWSPFTAVRWDDDSPFVRIIGREEWYNIRTIHGQPMDAILAQCESKGWDPKKRFTEDPVQLLRLLGHKVDKSISLRLRDETGQGVLIKNAPMTEEARNQCVFPFKEVPGYPTWSPFCDVKWKGDTPLVKVKALDGWFELVSIHGIRISAIEKSCEDNRWDMKKRVAEDIVQLIRLMGYEIDRSTSLKLRNGSGKEFELNDIEMTNENLR